MEAQVRHICAIVLCLSGFAASAAERPRYSPDQLAAVNSVLDTINDLAARIDPDRLELVTYQEGKDIDFWKNACTRDASRVTTILQSYRKKPSPSNTVELFLDVRDCRHH